MKFWYLYKLGELIVRLKKSNLPLETLYSLVNMQDTIVKNTMFDELSKRESEIKVSFLQDSKTATDEEKELLVEKINKELSEISDIDIDLDKDLSFHAVVDPKMCFLTLEDINLLRTTLGDNFKLVNKENNLAVVI